MSIQSEITRITNNVQDTIDVIEQAGVSIPAGANSDSLPSLAQALANEKQDKLTGTEGQVVGFDAQGDASPTDISDAPIIKDSLLLKQNESVGLPNQKNPFGKTIYAGERFFAPWDLGTLLSSENGLDWKEIQMPANVRWTSVTYGAGRFVSASGYSASGDQTTIAAYSDNGISWTQTELPTAGRWLLAYGNGKFVAIDSSSNNYVLCSNDGISWETTFYLDTLGAGVSFYGLYYVGNTFVAILTNGKVITSPDGISWTNRENAIIESGIVQYASCDDGKLVVMDGFANFAYSEDGLSWETAQLPDGDVYGWSCIIFSNGKFVLIGSPNIAAYSENGSTFTKTRMPFPQNPFILWKSLCYGAEKFIAIGQIENLSVLAYSKDGVTWENSISGLFNTSGDNVTQIVADIVGIDKKLDSPTGLQGQLLGFVSDNVVGAVNANGPIATPITLTTSAWSSNTQTVTVQGVETSGQSVRISPATKTDADNWVAAGVWCSEPKTANQLVFTCDTAPTENININVELQEVQS